MKADILLKNACILSMDESFQTFYPGAIAIKKDEILAVGEEKEILEKFSADSIIDCNEKVLMPGFVNAHTHVPMTLLRGLADDLRLDVWLLGYMMPVEREYVTPEFVQLGTLLACAEMIKSGITTFADMYYFEDDVAEATVKAGMRAICGESILKFPTPDSASYEEGLAYARKFIEKWKNHPLITPAIAPHAPYTCTDEILQASAALAREFDVPLHIHISETATEVEEMRKNIGMPVVPYVKKQTLLDTKLIAAHCVHIDEGEMRSLSHANAGIAHNPSSNMKLASGIAQVQRMLELGVNVGIGTDGPASNNDLDMFEEIRLASFLSKVSTGDPTSLPARDVLALATTVGAKAVHLQEQIGSLEPGKKADLIIIDVSPVHNSPRFQRDPDSVYAQIVYAAKSTDVTDVMINGKWVFLEKELQTLDEKSLLKDANKLAKEIDTFLIEREQSVLSKLIAIGGASEAESFEVQTKVCITNPAPIVKAINSPELEILRERHYREYDTYFYFENPSQGKLRYREDHFVGDKGKVTQVRSRLTHIGVSREYQFGDKALLSRSRYLAPASQSLRFYREYFKPAQEVEIEKDRLRFLIKFQDTEFFINIDTIEKPDLGYFLEIKSRTWSRSDADVKAEMIPALLELLGASIEHIITDDYIEIVEKR
ncbi:MAG: amidohydrolase family protein [Anaerolineaceae bacterium]|nr:amidohydrolase family protein [Anaerolineaceae bacterium]